MGGEGPSTRIAEEHAAVRRVAVLVARGAPPEEVFAAVAAETGRLLESDLTVMGRFDEDGALARRSPEPTELAAYYVVAEALTNAAKYADATIIDVMVTVDDGVLRVEVHDDGHGGADITHGSGLVGLTDRVETLGGRMSLHSPAGEGTHLEFALPLS